MSDIAMNNLPGHIPILLNNDTCPYCGVLLTPEVTSKEHVVGRRFVPKGKLDGNWNLVLRACLQCNRYKSDLEDDLSAISMHPTAWGQYAHEDESLAQEAERKAENSTSRRTRRRVRDSSEDITVEVPLGSTIHMTINLSSPPQADSRRIFELARLQLMGFFYFLTYDKDKRIGHYWLGDFCPLLEALKSDWGNSIHRAFMQAVIEWEPRLIAFTAGGYFKVAIRRHPSAVCWSWAVEWNHNLRVVGFFGDSTVAGAIVKTFPSLGFVRVVDEPDRYVNIRSEIALSEENDILFKRHVEDTV